MQHRSTIGSAFAHAFQVSDPVVAAQRGTERRGAAQAPLGASIAPAHRAPSESPTGGSWGAGAAAAPGLVKSPKSVTAPLLADLLRFPSADRIDDVAKKFPLATHAHVLLGLNKLVELCPNIHYRH